MSKIVYGYKDFFSRFSLIFTGIVVLVGINAIFRVWIAYPEVRVWYVIVLVLMSWVCWRLWRILNKLHYVFDEKGITIVLPGRKRFLLQKSHITNIEEVAGRSWWHGRGIKHIRRKNEFHFTTSTQHLLKITMDDGRVVFISPKEYVKE